MLETVDLGRAVDPATYERSFRPLRDRLQALQREVYEARIPIVVVLEGWDASGKGDTIEKLVGRLDPRGYKVHAIHAPTPEEAMRPFLWRFWTRIPGHGEIAIFDRSWYHRVLVDRVDGDAPRWLWQQAYAEINAFERMLADDGAVILKYWLHISAEEQRRRFKRIERSKFDSWRVTKKDWRAHRRYPAYHEAAEEMLERTTTPQAPWTIVEATDKLYRRLRVFETMAHALEEALEARRRAPPAAKAPAPAKRKEAARTRRHERTVLDEVDLSRRLPERRYARELKRWQARLRELEFTCHERRRPVVVVYEGWDAAGKGGNIKRVIGALDPRGYSVIPIAAPKGDDATHHYLWRFWNRIPKAGHLAIFDRSWYGRVLVERIEGFCTEAEWRRAFHEINEFELSLHHFGTVIVKLWLHLSKEEQLRRFRERQRLDFKRYKITEEDWRNREKWDLYREAVADAVGRTSTSYAPWTIVEANDKPWSRIKAMRTIAEAIEAGLDRKVPARPSGRA
jgi:polyphosphate kinase 2 (PPK2 family)